ncbi:MAG: hypothetical protein IPJ26_17030 [Bacteroidetes bacterium]|nr:hypothetical protein [Bacteroidota bacterium]
MHLQVPFIKEIIEHLIPNLKNTLSESLKNDLIPEFNKTLEEEINKGHEVVYDAGIIGCKKSMKFADFLTYAIDHFSNNSTRKILIEQFVFIVLILMI